MTAQSRAAISASPARAWRDWNRVAVVFHGDADGISSAALFTAAFARAGAHPFGMTPPKGIDVYDAAFVEGLERARPDGMVVVDTGSRTGFVWDVAPTMIVDHHPFASPPVCAELVHDENARSTSLLSWPVASQIADVGDRTWLVAVGALGDAGDAARKEPIVAAAAKRHGIGVLRDVVALVNAAGRASRPANDVAYDALVAAESPRDVLASDALCAMREEVASAITSARRVAPKVIGRWAIVELDDPRRIHGVIASTWARRLAPRITLVANRGYMPDRVHLSVRAGGDVDVRRALRELLPDEGPNFAAGHARASGAIVDVPTYERLVAAISR